jgi:hypothetical protein
MTARRLDHGTEGGRLRALAHNKHVEIWVSRGAEGGLQEVGILRSDLPTILRNSSVIRSERRGRQWRRIIRGCDTDGTAVTLAITVAYAQRRIAILEVYKELANDR